MTLLEVLGATITEQNNGGCEIGMSALHDSLIIQLAAPRTGFIGLSLVKTDHHHWIDYSNEKVSRLCSVVGNISSHVMCNICSPVACRVCVVCFLSSHQLLSCLQMSAAPTIVFFL